ncbi:hypothetical protein Clacol_007718 [Clathrus columnatus]|uniref:Uncharacterized protein n=1 Tax=Clathrus columnatus TaxID=1419009 RepID=A0AAV5AL90_9AGAM|nr:hypothetical protein Clacol_007718 [Clathrus columnatus]
MQPTLATSSDVDFAPPNEGGGSMLDMSKVGGSMLDMSGGDGLGEPLNVGSPSSGIHIGIHQPANLGDGNGPLNEIKVRRENFGIKIFGTLFETLAGGNHFRYWRQNGPAANTGALFLAVSYEKNVFTLHSIATDGYDRGRDNFVARAVGKTSYNGVRYSTTSKTIEGLLPIGANGINHDIPIDGGVALLTITILPNDSQV